LIKIFIYIFYFILILALDGWSSPNHRSIWNFTILTPSRKEYIFQLSDFSDDSHTAEFISEKIEDIINRVGVSKFSAIVSDNGSNVRKARELTENKFPNIMNVRCISHYINLMSCDVVRHQFADKLLRKVNILAAFFRNNARAGRDLSLK
jgi:hypothetical protein